MTDTQQVKTAVENSDMSEADKSLIIPFLEKLETVDLDSLPNYTVAEVWEIERSDCMGYDEFLH